MNHRLQKLAGVYREKGVGAAAGFLAEDVYFRVLAALAFPGRRSGNVDTEWAGRDPFEEFVQAMNERAAGGTRVLEVGSRAVSGGTVRGASRPGWSMSAWMCMPGPTWM